jgi:hypothetical protein
LGGLLTHRRLAILALLPNTGLAKAAALRLAHDLSRIPRRTPGFAGTNAGHRTARLVLALVVAAEQCVAHRIEEATGRRLLGRAAAFQFSDTLMGALQRLVLQEHGLH